MGIVSIHSHTLEELQEYTGSNERDIRAQRLLALTIMSDTLPETDSRLLENEHLRRTMMLSDEDLYRLYSTVSSVKAPRGIATLAVLGFKYHVEDAMRLLARHADDVTRWLEILLYKEFIVETMEYSESLASANPELLFSFISGIPSDKIYDAINSITPRVGEKHLIEARLRLERARELSERPKLDIDSLFEKIASESTGEELDRMVRTRSVFRDVFSTTNVSSIISRRFSTRGGEGAY